MKHRSLWLIAIFALSLVCPVHARLTEKEDELIKRFGKVEMRSETKRSFEGRIYLVGIDLYFKSDQWSIHALMIDGRCAQITYKKTGSWTDEQIVGLLDRNGGYPSYIEQDTRLGRSLRKWKKEGGITAVYNTQELELTHPLLERRLALLKAKAEAESKQPPKF
jgi:hypothetical protein